MGFVLEQTPTFSWPITIRERVDNGRYRSHSFEAVFKRLPQSRLEQLAIDFQQIRHAVKNDDLIDRIPTREIANEILVGWSGITEPDNTTQIPYSDESKLQLLEIETVAETLVQTYIESIEKAKSKN
ncbi:MAG: hypothetical protein WCF98_08865 [Synechococcus sp. ELA057]|jgi:hypothetical protein